MHTSQNNFHIQHAVRPGLWRVFASMFYDLWLVLAIWLIGVTLDTFVRHALTGSGYLGNHLLLQAYLLSSSLLFYTWFWMHGGQTLGMRSWRIKVFSTSGEPLSWRQALVRYVCAALSLCCLGFGYLWILFDKNKASWHDKLSNTCLVMVQKKR